MTYFEKAAKNRYSWRLRFTVAENLASLSQHFDTEVVKDQILPIYELLLRDAEPEVRSEAIAKVPLIAENCDSMEFVDQIMPIIS